MTRCTHMFPNCWHRVMGWGCTCHISKTKKCPPEGAGIESEGYEGMNLSRDDMMEAISEGVRRAIWEIANNATDAPCADFYDAIKAGTESGISILEIRHAET